MRSLTNDTMQRATKGQPEPTIGMGATLLSYSDRHAATITAVNSLSYNRWDCLIRVQQDVARMVSGSGHDGSAVYEFTRNPEAKVLMFARRVGTGRWDSVRLAEYKHRSGATSSRFVSADVGRGLAIGFRSEYYDPHF